MRPIVVFGGLLMDITFEIPRWPQPNESDVLYATQITQSPGGKGLNQSVGACRLGAEVILVGCVGADTPGRAILETLEHEKVNTDLIEVRSIATTGTVGILLHDSKPTYIANQGASTLVSDAQIEKAATAIGPDTIVLVNHELPQAIVAEALRVAKARGATTILNPGPLAPWIADVPYLPLVDYLIPNFSEAQAILNSRGTEPETLLRDILGRGVGATCITLGDRGCIFAEKSSPDRVIREPALPVEVVDTTGAGDAFCAAWAVGIAEGWSREVCVKFGVAASGKACTVRGSMIAMPYRQEVEGIEKNI